MPACTSIDRSHENQMTIERFGRRTYPGGVVHAPFIRAGKWVFGTGLRATTPEGGMDPGVLRRGHPLGQPPQAQREADSIFAGMAHHLESAGSSMSRVARLDQYYPDARYVDPYHVARKKALAGHVAPRTSVIRHRLLHLDASMDVQVLAATPASRYRIQQPEHRRLN